MQGLEQHLEKEKTGGKVEGTVKPRETKGTRGDIDDEDDEESYYRYARQKTVIKFSFG